MEPDLNPSNPNYADFVRHQFMDATFIRALGIELVDFGPGWVETRAALRPDLLQQDGFAHAGVVSTMADHSAGGSAGTLCPAGKKVLTVEFKINLLRPGKGDSLRCRAEVVRAGRTITVSESEVFAVVGGTEKLVAKALVTLAIV